MFRVGGWAYGGDKNLARNTGEIIGASKICEARSGKSSALFLKYFRCLDLAMNRTLLFTRLYLSILAKQYQHASPNQLIQNRCHRVDSGLHDRSFESQSSPMCYSTQAYRSDIPRSCLAAFRNGEGYSIAFLCEFNSWYSWFERLTGRRYDNTAGSESQKGIDAYYLSCRVYRCQSSSPTSLLGVAVS